MRPAGATIDNKHYLYYDVLIPGNDTFTATMGITLATTDVVSVLIKNGALTGNPNFLSYSTESMSMWDNTSTAVTYTDNSQLIWSGQIGAAGQISFAFTDEMTLQPGEYLSVATKTANGSPTVSITLNTREDQ